MIKFKCPLCGEPMEAPESLRAKPLVCPSCGELVKACGVNPVIEEVRVKNKNKFRQHPVYEKQHWIVFGTIILSLSIGIWVMMYVLSWEYQNKDQINKLSQEVIEAYQQDDLRETVHSYLLLENFLDDRRIKNSELADKIQLCRQQYNEAGKILLAHKKAKLQAQAQLNYVIEQFDLESPIE